MREKAADAAIEELLAEEAAEKAAWVKSRSRNTTLWGRGRGRKKK